MRLGLLFCSLAFLTPRGNKTWGAFFPGLCEWGAIRFSSLSILSVCVCLGGLLLITRRVRNVAQGYLFTGEPGGNQKREAEVGPLIESIGQGRAGGPVV